MTKCQSSLESTVKELTGTIENLEKTNRELNEIYDQKSLENEGNARETTRLIGTHEEAIQELHRTISSSQRKVQEVNGTVIELTKEKLLLLEQLNEKNNDIQGLFARINLISSENNELKDKIKTLSKDIRKLDSLIKIKGEAAAEDDTEDPKYKGKIYKETQSIHETLFSLEIDVCALRMKLTWKNEQVQFLYEEMANQQRRIEANRTDYFSKINDKAEEVHQTHNQLQLSSRDLIEKDSEISQLKVELKSSTEETMKTIEESNILQETITRHTLSIGDLQKTIETLSKPKKGESKTKEEGKKSSKKTKTEEKPSKKGKSKETEEETKQPKKKSKTEEKAPKKSKSKETEEEAQPSKKSKTEDKPSKKSKPSEEAPVEKKKTAKKGTETTDEPAKKSKSKKAS